MAVVKTRIKLVDVARQLFAKKGLENTTMNDIAQASGKGRRTLYTYFKSKEEIYWAVIEGELERINEKMNEVANQQMEPEDKLVEVIYTHLNMIKEAVQRNGNLRAEFFRNIIMVEKVRKNFDRSEQKLFASTELCRRPQRDPVRLVSRSRLRPGWLQVVGCDFGRIPLIPWRSRSR